MRARFTLLVLAAANVVSAQRPQAAALSPIEVVKQYIRMGDDGSLLTPKGWKTAQALFVEPTPMPKNKVIYLFSKGGSVGEVRVKDDRAEVEQLWRDPLGTIDSELRYSPGAENRGEGAIYLYRLVLTDKHWELGPDGAPKKQVTGTSEWKLEGPYTQPWTTLDAAIPYVTQMRDKATDARVKHNAERTLTILKNQLHSTARH